MTVVRKNEVRIPPLSLFIFKIMKEKLLKKRNEILQNFANFIIERLEHSKTEREFNVWLNLGLNINYWCVEREIYLD